MTEYDIHFKQQHSVMVTRSASWHAADPRVDLTWLDDGEPVAVSENCTLDWARSQIAPLMSNPGVVGAAIDLVSRSGEQIVTFHYRKVRR